MNKPKRVALHKHRMAAKKLKDRPSPTSSVVNIRVAAAHMVRAPEPEPVAPAAKPAPRRTTRRPRAAAEGAPLEATKTGPEGER